MRSPPGGSARGRWISLAEATIASLVVVGDNVWHVLPNSVLLLCAMALISCRLRAGGWSTLGLRAPRSWIRILLVAVVAVAVQQALGQFVVDPLTRPFARYAAGANPMAGMHGYAGLLWSSAMFGCAHWYQGPAGVISALVSGIVFGAAYLGTRRNLWTSIFAHGLSDSMAAFLTCFQVAG